MTKPLNTKKDLQLPPGWKRVATVSRNWRKIYRFEKLSSGRVVSFPAANKREAIALLRKSVTQET